MWHRGGVGRCAGAERREGRPGAAAASFLGCSCAVCAAFGALAGRAFVRCGTMADDGKVFLDANGLYLDSFKLARKIWDDGFRPTVTPPTVAVLLLCAARR